MPNSSITTPGEVTKKKRAPAKTIKTAAKQYDDITAKKATLKRKQNDLEVERKVLELEKAKSREEEINFYDDVLDRVLSSMMDIVKNDASSVEREILQSLKEKLLKGVHEIEKVVSTPPAKDYGYPSYFKRMPEPEDLGTAENQEELSSFSVYNGSDFP